MYISDGTLRKQLLTHTHTHKHTHTHTPSVYVLSHLILRTHVTSPEGEEKAREWPNLFGPACCVIMQSVPTQWHDAETPASVSQPFCMHLATSYHCLNTPLALQTAFTHRLVLSCTQRQPLHARITLRQRATERTIWPHTWPKPCWAAEAT